MIRCQKLCMVYQRQMILTLVFDRSAALLCAYLKMQQRLLVLLAVCSPEVAGHPRPYGGRYTLPFGDESNRTAQPGPAATLAAARPPPPFSPSVGVAEHRAVRSPAHLGSTLRIMSTRLLAFQWDESLPSGSPPQLPSPPPSPLSPPSSPSPPSPPPPPTATPPYSFCYPCTGPISWEVLNFTEAITGFTFLLLVVYYVYLWVPADYIWVDPDWHASMQRYLVAVRLRLRPQQASARYLSGATTGAGTVVAPQ